MPARVEYDAVVVGSGPNGLAAAITLARAGHSVVVFEAREVIGGGTRSAELTLPGFIHDVCSAIHPLGVASPFFRLIELEKYGVEWVQPSAPLAHPLDDGTAVLLERSFEATGQRLGRDTRAYQRLLEPMALEWEKILEDILGPFPLPPKHPILLSRFGLRAIRSARGLAESIFEDEPAKALFAGIAGHSVLSLDAVMSSAAGMLLGMLGHAVGWPMVKGGSQKIADALAKCLCSMGGEIIVSTPIRSLAELPPAKAVLLDVTPRQFIKITRDRIPAGYKRQLERYRYGPGVFKIDYALSDPIPWKATEVSRAATVHLGGSLDELAAAEKAVWRGEHPDKPYLLLTQQTLFDLTRAPLGKHTAWVYTHVPNGSTVDMTKRIESQIERFAPGFKDCVLEKFVRTPPELEEYNPNYIGGDIAGGVQDIFQQFTRPVPRLNPYITPIKGVYLCSSSTPPGGGVHGMCGFNAAKVAIERLNRSR